MEPPTDQAHSLEVREGEVGEDPGQEAGGKGLQDFHAQHCRFNSSRFLSP